MTSIPAKFFTPRWMLFLSLFVLAFLCVPLFAYADTETQDFPVETVDLYINKHISGEDLGFELSDFLYRIVGDGVDAIVSHDSAIALRPGTYSIEELAPGGFAKEDWRIGWYGQCERGSAYMTSITIEEDDLEHGTLYCEADNQYRPENNDGDGSDDEDTSNDTNATGTITVSKVIVGTATVPEQFSFSVNGDTSVVFEADGENVVEVASGTYAIVEDNVDSYTTTYSDGCVGEIVGNEEVSCIITNTWESVDDDDGGGNGGSDPDLYRIEGYVWHDDNENTEWDGFDNKEEATTTEDELKSWTVKITNGTDTFSTTTDPTGHYYFEVPAGTWTITEVLEDGWSLITPSSGSFIITVPGEGIQITLLERVRNFLIPVAYAAVVETYGPFNFGNNESSSGGDGSDPSGDSDNSDPNLSRGGGSSRPVCEVFTINESGNHFVLAWETKRGKELAITQNGLTIFDTTIGTEVGAGSILSTTDLATYELVVKRGSRTDICKLEPVFDGRDGAFLPEPQVLGEQVAIVPVGAPAAGAGGGSPVSIPSAQFAQSILLRQSLRSEKDNRFQ